MHNPTGVHLFFSHLHRPCAALKTCLQLRFTPAGCCILQSIYLEITLCEELIPNSSFLIPNYYSLALIAALSASYPGLSRSANIFFL